MDSRPYSRAENVYVTQAPIFLCSFRYGRKRSACQLCKVWKNTPVTVYFISLCQLFQIGVRNWLLVAFGCSPGFVLTSTIGDLDSTTAVAGGMTASEVGHVRVS